MLIIHHSEVRTLYGALQDTPNGWKRIVSSFQEMAEVWKTISNNHFKDLVTIDTSPEQPLLIEASALDKRFNVELSPTLIQMKPYGKIVVYTDNPLKAERIEVASLLVDRRGQFFNTDETPFVAINEAMDNHFLLLGNIVTELLSQ